MKFFVNNLQHRFQRIVINGEITSFQNLSHLGSPKVPYLDPFLMFINDMTECVNIGIGAQIF